MVNLAQINTVKIRRIFKIIITTKTLKIQIFKAPITQILTEVILETTVEVIIQLVKVSLILAIKTEIMTADIKMEVFTIKRDHAI